MVAKLTMSARLSTPIAHCDGDEYVEITPRRHCGQNVRTINIATIRAVYAPWNEVRNGHESTLCELPLRSRIEKSSGDDEFWLRSHMSKDALPRLPDGNCWGGMLLSIL